ncbi:MAG TPA: elongation factor P [Alphaproteobacteria bacterium]
MPKVNCITLRAGHVIDHNNKIMVVTKHEIMRMQMRQGTIQLTLKDVRTGLKDSIRFTTGEMVERVRLDQSESTFLFGSGDDYTFMDGTSFEQVTINGDFLGEEKAALLTEGMPVQIEFYEGEPLSVELPEKVTVTIQETEPVIKGQTASGSFKPAILDNGLRIMVPTHVTAGDRVVIKSDGLEYVERAKD